MKTTVKILSLIFAVTLIMGMTVSCKDEKYEAYDRTGQPYDYYLPDYVKVCDYMGIEIPEVVYVPSEEDITAKIMQLAGYYSDRTEDPPRPCRDYDYVDIITTCRFADTGEPYSLYTFEKNDNGIGQTFMLGTNHFMFPALDEAVRGMSQGETKTVTLTLPDPFYKDFINSGREVEMEIYLNYIDEVDFSQVSDEFYYEHYGYYGEGMRNSIIEDLRKQYNELIEGYEVAIAWNYICDNSELKKVPEKEYNDIYESKLNAARSAAQGKDMTLKEYVKDLGYESLDTYYEYLEEYAKNICYEDMLLYYIIRYENLDYDQEFYEKTVLSMVEDYELTDFTEAESFLEYYMGKEDLHESVLMQYTQQWLVDNGEIRSDINQFFSDKLNKNK